MREDSAIAVFWTLGMALGIIFTYLSPGFAPDLSSYLFGNILTIAVPDLLFLGIVALLTTLFFALYIRTIIAIAFDREFAASQGIHVRLFEYLLMMLIALCIVGCLRLVGIVLVISLLTIPQLTVTTAGGRSQGGRCGGGAGGQTEAGCNEHHPCPSGRDRSGGGKSLFFY